MELAQLECYSSREGIIVKTDNGESTSVWMPTPGTRAALQLTTDVETDVCIIGAGIAGMTTACLLAREGRASSSSMTGQWLVGKPAVLQHIS